MIRCGSVCFLGTNNRPELGRRYEMTDEIKTEIATFAGGCFWCTEAVFKGLKGVKAVPSCFMG
jgi:hypothetical protein